MKKTALSMILFIVVFLLSGCDSSSLSNKKDTNTLENSSKLRNMVEQNLEYKIVDSGKYPYEYSEYDDENMTVFTFYADTKSDVLAFYKKYKSLTGKEYKKEFSGVMVVVKAGFKSDSSYTLKVKNIEKSPRYNIAHIKLKREKSLSLDAVSVPYIIINIKNTHKSTKAFIE